MKFDLAELQKRLQVRAVLAVTLESGRMVVEYVRQDDSVSQSARSIVLPLGADAVLADPERAGQRLAAELATAGLRERRCVVCLPAGWAMATSTDVPGVTAEDLRGFLELRAEREFPMPVSDLRLAHCEFVLPDGKERATLAAVPAKRVEAIERMLATAECRAVSLSLGLDTCLPIGGAPAALHFLANGNHVDVVIAAGGGIAAVRTLPTSVNAETTAFEATLFSREVRITLGRLPEALRQQVREARFGGAPNSAQNLCQEMRPHLTRMGIESRLENKAGTDPAAHPASAHAAATRYLRQLPVTFEFLPPQVNRWQAMARQLEDRRRRWAAIAVLAILMLPILTYFVRAHMESSLNSEWSGMQGKVNQLDKLQQRIRQFRAWFDPAPQSVQALETLDSSFPEQGDVWAKSVQINDGAKVVCTGFARSHTALLGFLDSLRKHPEISAVQLQQERGEKPVQFSIIYKWGANDVR